MKTQRAEFTRALVEVDRGYALNEKFIDFLSIVASSLRQGVNAFLGKFDSALEEYICNTQKKYRNYKYFADALAIMTESLEKNPCDFLGAWAGEESQLNKDLQQYFTPYSMSVLTAKLSLLDRIDPQEKPLTINEPTCGSGGMIIATAQELKSLGYSNRDFYVLAQDIDLKCVNMTYIQCTLLDIPAWIYHGNTIMMEFYKEYKTFSAVRNYPFGVPRETRNFNNILKPPVATGQLTFNL